MRTVKSTNYIEIRKLDAQLFNSTDTLHPIEQGTWFLTWLGGVPVAYSAIDLNTGYLSRAGVLPCARGKNLQRLHIRRRIDAALAAGLKRVYTDVMAYNVPSHRSLVREGFLPYRPDPRVWYAHPDVVYLERLLY